jgi:hypothetical protein
MDSTGSSGDAFRPRTTVVVGSIVFIALLSIAHADSLSGAPKSNSPAWKKLEHYNLGEWPDAGI